MKKRTIEFTNLADQLGWVYYPEFPTEVIPYLEKLDLNKVLNLVQNSNHAIFKQSGDCKELVLNLSFLAGKIPVELTVYLHEDLTMSLPHIFIQPENLFHRIGAYLGMQDIDFSNYPDFSSNYRIKGEPDDTLYKLFTDQVKGYFSYEKGWIIEMNKHQILLYKEDKKINTTMISPFILAAQTIVALFKNQIVL
ncbi:MAG: hypothetical protein ABI761_04350 [Saprospiraceae bacterium]